MKKICITLLCCFFLGSIAYAEDMYYEKFTDSKTGRQIEYIDFGEDTMRPYFTQNGWFTDNKSFIISRGTENGIYRYDTETHKAEMLFGSSFLPLDHAAVVGPDDTVYAANHTDGNLYAQRVSTEADATEVLSMTLPFKDNYTVDEEHTADEGEDYTENGLTFRLNNVNRYRDCVTVPRQRGGKWCRATVSERRSGSGNLWFDYYSYSYTMASSHMSYTVDNSKISTNTRNITIEFDYYDDDNSELSGKNIEIQYLAYNNGGTAVKKTKAGPAFTGSNTWKTAKVTLEDAQFDKSGALNDGGGHNFDFRIGIGYNRGGFASTWVKVYKTPISYTGEISFEVNSAGTGYTGELEPSIWGSYDRDIGYSGTDGMSAVGGKHFVYNKEYAGYTQSGQGWKRWKNALYFNVPDGFLYGDTYRTVEVEVEYYVNEDCQIELVAKNGSGSDVTVGKLTASSGSWRTRTFKINPSSGVVFSNKFDSSSDFRIGFTDQGYIHKVTLKKSNVENLGYKEGGWHPHVSKNGDLSLTHGDNTIIIYEANRGKFATTDIYNISKHALINPEYPNLVLYSYEGPASTTTHDRIRLFNRSNMFKGCIFTQHKNSSDGATTGESVGHEVWSPDGEHIVAVKYVHDTNIGKNGIIRMDKNGENREYVNDDYDYWHCAASPDGRWIVADTEPVNDATNIVLIDTKTGKSYLVATQRAFREESSQPHPNFNKDGTKVTFGMGRRKLNSSDENYVAGIGIADVSDIVNDGQIGEPAAPTDYSLSSFEIGFNKDTGKNEVSTVVDNIDGQTRDINLLAAVYDSEGKLISVGKKRYYSANDETLTAGFDDAREGDTLKCFLWDDDGNPIKNSVGTIKLLRAAKTGVNEIVLSWQYDGDMPVLKYEVFRGNAKIGETTDTVYRDSGLSKNTQYTYYVRPVYSNVFYVGENGAAISADLDELNFDGIYSVLGRPSTNHGLTFLENDNLATDSFTEFKVQDGESCRMARRVEQGETDEQGNKRWGSAYNGMFYFKCDRNAVTASTNKVLIGVRYYDNRDVALGIDYKNTSGTVSSKTVVTKTNTNAWKTATITLDDAKFVDSDELSGYDFRFQGGYSMYISRVWVIPLDENGNMRTNDGMGSGAVGDKAGIKITTKGETISATLAGDTITENGLHFVLNKDSSKDGYTEGTDNAGGTWCRQNTSASTSMFCFKVDKDIIPEDVTSVDIAVNYYGYNYNGGKIQLLYTATDGTTKTVDVATPSTSSNKSWKTATVSLTDAKFIAGLNCNSDFVIKGTKSAAAKIKNVTVTKKSTPAASAYQSVEWTASSSSGLSHLSSGGVSGEYLWVNGNMNDWHKFGVDDVYMYGKSNNMAWVDITYVDSGTSKIYLFYNTSDPTATAPKADKEADTVITCTNTGELKTARIPLIDANFSNYSGYDFVIRVDSSESAINGVSIKKVKVVGY